MQSDKYNFHYLYFYFSLHLLFIGTEYILNIFIQKASILMPQYYKYFSILILVVLAFREIWEKWQKQHSNGLCFYSCFFLKNQVSISFLLLSEQNTVRTHTHVHTHTQGILGSILPKSPFSALEILLQLRLPGLAWQPATECWERAWMAVNDEFSQKWHYRSLESLEIYDKP